MKRRGRALRIVEAALIFSAIFGAMVWTASSPSSILNDDSLMERDTGW